MSIEDIFSQLEKYASLGETRIDSYSYDAYTIGETLLMHYSLMQDGLETIKDYAYIAEVLRIAYKYGPDALPKAKYIKTLLAAGASPDGQADCFTALGIVCLYDNAECCKILLEAGADPNIRAKDENGNTMLWHEPPLYTAVDYKSHKCCQLLLEHGADANAKLASVGFVGNNRTALMRAAYKDDTESCALLLKHGADINARDGEGKTPLMHAVERGNSITCKYLLKNGAAPSAADKDGETALMAAARLPDADCCALLLEHGADVNAVSNYGKTALKEAMRMFPSPQNTIELLKKHGAKE